MGITYIITTNTKYLWSTASRGFCGENTGEKRQKPAKMTPRPIKIKWTLTLKYTTFPPILWKNV